jgi:transposase
VPDVAQHPVAPLEITPEQRTMVEAWVRATTTPQRVVLRSRIVLLAADGLASLHIARQLGVSQDTVRLWRRRFALAGAEGLLEDAPGRGRKPIISADRVQQVVHATLHERPPQATHWTLRTMAAHTGLSASFIHHVWQAHGLQPHRARTFKLSSDPAFVEKLVDVVGLYLHPPDRALVLCVDEKTQIQALQHTQPGLPLKRGRAGTYTHDYRRHGTTTLFAALNILEGTVIGTCLPRHRHQEFLTFLRQIDRETPPDVDLHLVMDNLATHQHPRVRQWLAKHPRFFVHFTPTSSSWLNLVEPWFSHLARRQLKRGDFCSVHDLTTAIYQYIEHNNAAPTPFVWTAPAARILDKVRKCRAILESLH